MNGEEDERDEECGGLRGEDEAHATAPLILNEILDLLTWHTPRA